MPIADVSHKSICELVSLKGRVAVVTGGGRGIGRAICNRFAEAGAQVIAADKDLDKAEEEENRTSASRRIAFYELDVRDGAAMETIAARAEKEFGSLDIWVNNAGIFPVKKFFELTEGDWNEVIATNLTGAFHGARAAAKRMKKKGGVILNLSSVVGFHGSEQYVHYVTSKFGIRGLTAALAKECGEHNIRVIGLAPTFVDTPGVREEKKAMDEKSGGDTYQKHAERVPLGRYGLPDDVARVALFAASDLALFVSGSTILVDGGDIAFG